jgi:hypothetical protein
MQEPKDVHQLRAFLGCCQQLNQYIKDYDIIVKPLHNITKKGVKGPPPWIKGSDYDIAKQMRSLLESISADPQLKQSKDSILLAEDQYSEHLDSIFNKLAVPTTLQNTMNVLRWKRHSCDSTYEAGDARNVDLLAANRRHWSQCRRRSQAKNTY